MNKIYEKGVTRNQQAYSHTLAILMSMLRVWLEYGWSMARVWLKYAWSMLRVSLARRRRGYGSSVTRLRLVGHEVTPHHFPAPDAHIRKRKCLGTRLFGCVLYSLCQL